MKTTVPQLLLTSALLVGSLAAASAATLSFDFTRTTGDRAYYFGTSQTNGTFDNASATGGFYVQSGVFKSPNINGGANPSAYWSIINDSQPDTVNTTLPSGSDAFKVSSNSALTLRTTMTGLSSGDSGVLSLGGFLIGLTDFTSTASGILAVVNRTPGSNSSCRLNFYNFSSGAVGTLITQSSTFTYAGSTALYLDLQIAANGNYSFGAFSDAGMTTSLASVTGASLAGYNSGYAGLFYYDAGGTNVGSADYTSFSMTYTAVPEPGTTSLLAAFGLAFVLYRRRRRAH